MLTAQHMKTRSRYQFFPALLVDYTPSIIWYIISVIIACEEPLNGLRSQSAVPTCPGPPGFDTYPSEHHGIHRSFECFSVVGPPDMYAALLCNSIRSSATPSASQPSVQIPSKNRERIHNDTSQLFDLTVFWLLLRRNIGKALSNPRSSRWKPRVPRFPKPRRTSLL